MKVLCVAEKNSIAKAVSQILGGGSVQPRDSGYQYVKNYDFQFSGFPFVHGDYGIEVTMTSVAGHLTNIDFSNDRHGWGKCHIYELFDAPLLEVMNKNQKAIAENIKREAKSAQYVMIWTDCDREGEYIGWEIYQEAMKGNRQLGLDKLYRANFSHLERSHILYAAKHPHRLDLKSVDAVSTRMEIDLRAGVTFTRLLTETMRRRVSGNSPENTRSRKKDNSVVISYGTCQFPTLGFVVDRYERIRGFVPEEFWYIQLQIEDPVENKELTTFSWERGNLFDRLSVLTFYELCLENAGDKVTVIDIKSKPTTKFRPLPLTTVELQKNCARYLKINAKQSLDAAEKLYQKGFISYPRTETDMFPDKMDLKGIVKKLAPSEQSNRNEWADYADSLLIENGLNDFQFPRSGSRDDKAHPPIHPIVNMNMSTNNNGNSLSPLERKVYEFVVRHFLACCSQDARGQSTTLVLDWFGERFQTSGLLVQERNFLDVYPWAKWDSTRQVPALELNHEYTIHKAEMKSGKTTPPKPMTESELISLMDANGIGTDATIAEHIEKIQARCYVRSDKVGKETYLKPTTLGVALVHGFEALGLEDSFAKPFQRREMEQELRKICDGERTKLQVCAQIIEKYRRYWEQTNAGKSILLQVYDHVESTMTSTSTVR